MSDEPACPNCSGPLWIPPHASAGYQASIICECKEVGRREVKARIAQAKRDGRWGVARCCVCDGKGGFTGQTRWGEQDADCEACGGTGVIAARLIAAAPDLLHAAKLALELTDCIQDEEGFSPSVSIPAAALRAAIAKAIRP